MIFLGLSGLVCIAMGISFYLGHLRRPLVYWTTFSSGGYAATPLGIGLLLLSVMTQLPYPNKMDIWLTIMLLILLITAVVLSLTMPLSLSPWWFRFLREKYGDAFVMVLLQEAAANYDGWVNNTQTLEELEAWADGIRRSYRLEE
jgi:hypothetical protein